MYDERYSEFLYPHKENILKNTSQIDIEKLDFEKYPFVKDLPYWECILKPGQMLFIPARQWHFVRSLSISFSVSFWWN